MPQIQNIDPAWHLDEDFPGRAWLATKLHVCATPMHLQAIRVIQADELVAYDDIFAGELDAVRTLLGDAEPQTSTLGGLEGEWVILMVPHAD